MKIYLRDRNPDLVKHWEYYFQVEDDVQPSCGDIFGPGDHMKVDAIVSPANSFGYMDGGIDFVYSSVLGWGMSDDLRRKINVTYSGELLVGQAAIVDIRESNPNAKIRWLISAPTMRVPMRVANTVNAFLAFRAALKAAEEHPEINSFVCPGLGTAVGEMPYKRCALQMFEAYQMHQEPEFFDVLGAAHIHHHTLLNEDTYDQIFKAEHPIPRVRR
jgi:O-acetyl-ADP-ribose deacetylase (regulator of RNase III)